MPLRRLLTYLGLWAALVGIAGVGAALVLPVVFGSSFEETSTPLLLLLGGSGIFVVYYALLAALVGARRSELVAASRSSRWA